MLLTLGFMPSWSYLYPFRARDCASRCVCHLDFRPWSCGSRLRYTARAVR